MKKKVIVPIVLILLLAAGVFGGWLIFDSVSNSETENTEPADIAELIRVNADTAFDFLDKEENILPDNMRGYVVDIEADIDFSDASENALKAEADGIFEKVDAILPNTVVIEYSEKINYAPNGFDVLSYFISAVHDNEMYAILLLSDDDLSAENLKADKSVEIAEKYGIDGIMTELSGFTADIQAHINEIRKELNNKNITFGVLFNDVPSVETQALTESSCLDFCFVKINSSLSGNAQNIIMSWAEIALECKTKVYAILRNDLVMSGGEWTVPDEIYNQVRSLYNYGGFAGCVMQSHKKLSTNDNDTASNLYFYNEFFNDIDYTALTLTSFGIKDNNTVVISGTSEKEYPVHAWCTSSDGWQSAVTEGDDGKFTINLNLNEGENKIIIKHKNAMYTYYIDRVIDVMTAQSAVVEGTTVTLTATAVKGAKVWASIANTVTVELNADEKSNEKYVTYSANYELTEDYALLEPSQISYAASYAGINDIVMCGEDKALTPYDDHGLGTALMCCVTKNYAETTSTASEDDTSDPTCTPQLAGSYAYISDCSVKDNIVVYSAETGMKIHGEDSKLIIGGYKLPENKVYLESVTAADKTEISFSFDYLSFIKTVTAPQEYYKGALERIYNVEEFTAEYIDIIFMNTNQCKYTQEPDFSQSDVISKAEWYSNTEAGFMTLRLYFKTKGEFAGYSLYKNETGGVSIEFKKTVDGLSGTVIMLDPGHGGYGAPGTSSVKAIYEHEVVFDIAQQTADILREHGATVIVTRGENEALFLDERVNMIRETKPDIFVSIHCDGSDYESWLGTHTFYYKNYSMPLANSIHRQMLNAYRTYVYTDSTSKDYEKADNGCKFFPYMVTRVEECPSVLVECGYLTNEKDAAFLTDATGQQIISTAIAQGIVDYISAN